jgi:hypothetical protein
MRDVPLWAALLFVGVLGVVGTALALVWVGGFSCACAMAHPGLVVRETEAPEDMLGLEIVGFASEQMETRYGDLRVVAGEPTPEGPPPDAPWLATRGGVPLGPADVVRKGDALVVDLLWTGPAPVRVLHVPCNCYVATWGPPGWQ